MKRVYWIFAVIVTVCALSLNTFAQPGGGQGRGQGGPGGGMGPGMGMPGMGPGAGGIDRVLQNPEFAKMLELTPEQTTELQRITREATETMRTQFQNMPRREPGEGPPSPEAMREMRQRMETGMSEVQASVDRVLRPEQRTKLRETTFQLSGGLSSPALGTPMGNAALGALELTDAQREQIRKLSEERPRIDFEGIDDPRSQEGRAEMQRRIETVNTQFAEQVKGILTPEQQAKAEKLTAEAPALRERLGISAPGQPQPRGQQQRQAPPGGGFVPGQGAWRPGQTAPDAPAVAPGGQPRRPFPRNEN